jgi:hypothetical protein
VKRKIRKQNKARRKYRSKKKNTEAKRKDNFGSEKKRKIVVKVSLKHVKRKRNESRFTLKGKKLKQNWRTLLVIRVDSESCF